MRWTRGGSRDGSGETIYCELIATGLGVPWKCQLGGIAWVWSRSVTMLVASVVRRERRGSCGDMWLSHGGEQRKVKARSDRRVRAAASKNNRFLPTQPHDPTEGLRRRWMLWGLGWAIMRALCQNRIWCWWPWHWPPAVPPERTFDELISARVSEWGKNEG